jgi:hypothetical protein
MLFGCIIPSNLARGATQLNFCNFVLRPFS